jgi:protein-histidine N-methyltransferase
MGCGTAIPTLTLFHYAITEHLPLLFTLTDYNAAVLRLVTLPNLLLTWASTLQPTAPPFSAEEPNPLLDSGDGDLAITPELTAAFINHLRAQGLELTFISGSWTPPDPFLSLIPSAPTMNTLILASETIYSPTALSSFTAALTGLLSRVRLGKAMIAAKRVYFGVGGSVDAFKIECRERGAVAYEIENHGVDLGDEEGGWGGVRRCLVEVQML